MTGEPPTMPDCKLDVTGSPVIRSTAWLDAIACDDCMRVLPEMPDKSVDAVITDPPYGVTGNHWDIAPNLPMLWKELRRVCRGRIVIIATQPFATDVINANRENFKWDDVWVKPPSSVLNTGRHRKVRLRQQAHPVAGGLVQGRSHPVARVYLTHRMRAFLKIKLWAKSLIDARMR